MDEDLKSTVLKLKKDVKDLSILCAIMVLVMIGFGVFTVKNYVDVHITKSAVVNSGYFDTNGNWVNDGNAQYPDVSFGSGDTMEEAEKDAERNANR